VRVIGGEAKGRRLFVPSLPTLRPTSDRVREAIFDILEARELIEGASVLDLYAGSGALGIEALSRGAASCTFVDSDRHAVSAIEANLAAVGFSGRPGVRVVRSDVLAYLTGGTGGPAQVALLDPPYNFSGWPEVLEQLPAEVAILEHGAPVDLGARFHSIRAYRYGGTLVTLVSAQPTDKDPA
ncbi:MAG: 16S rRNA (guanine(966)-N(2))-methyltransferase RsmD, partial [Acidimicrobiales bacterium]